MTKIKNAEEPTIATTLPAEHWPDGVIPDGLIYVTSDEMRWLKEMHWIETGGSLLRTNCLSCGAEMTFQRDPRDWPSHVDPLTREVGDGDGNMVSETLHLRVKLECPKCGAAQFTDGVSEVDFIDATTADVAAETRAAVARRLSVVVEDVRSGDDAASGERGTVAPSE